VRAGGRVNGASPAYNAEEMGHALKTANTKFLFTLPGSLAVALEAALSVGLPRTNVFLLEGSRAGFTSVGDLIQIGSQLKAGPSWSVPKGQTNKNICGYLNFSSGTTGLPKAVMLSHHNLIAQCHQLKQLQLVSPGQRYRILAVMPLFHITGSVRFVHYPVFMNGDSIMLPAFNMEFMLKTIIEYKIEELILVPPIIIRIVRDPIVAKYLPDLQRSVKRWSSGSAPTAPEIIQLLHKKFPNTGFRQGYGATESTACISCHPPSHYDYKYASTGGLACANTELKVLDLDDPKKELGPGETGEICARGPQIAMGYLHNATATAETFKDGWLHTGDVGNIDEEGLIRIEDRIKEMIKVKGQQVPPAELEDLLLGHELVEDCAVLGIPDPYAGERPKAYVVLKSGVSQSQEVGKQLLQYVKEKKSRYKWITEIEFTDIIPKSPTGKLLRRVLKASDRQSGRVKGVSVRDDSEKARL
jgi:4-coumarate--CoA ligase